MSAQRSYCERIVELEEAVASLRMSNDQLSNVVAQMQRKMDGLRGETNIMKTTTTVTAIPVVPKTSINAATTTACTACGPVNILAHPMGAMPKQGFQQERMAVLKEAFGVLGASNAKVLERMAQMEKMLNELRTSNAELGTTSMRQSVSNPDLACQRSDMGMSDVKLRHMAAEHRQSESSNGACIGCSATALTSPATATAFHATLSNSIDPFKYGATTASFTICDEKMTSPSYSNITVSAPETTQASPLTTLPNHREALSKDLFNAAGRGNAEKICKLVTEGANIEFKDGNGCTALHRAAGRGHIDALKALIVLGAPLEAEDNDKSTPLHYTALYECEDCMKVLLSAGANINATDKYGGTPLHYAAVEQSRSIVEILIAVGADRGAKDNFGKMPKDYTMSYTLRALL